MKLKNILIPNYLYWVLILSMLLSLVSSCTDECESTRRFVTYEPVFISYGELRAPVEMTVPQVLSQPGKIYFKDGFIFINELGQGIHIINNQDPSNPQPIGFIAIPGNFDLAAKGNILYADRYIDLLAIDITDVNNPQVVNTVEDVFTYFDVFGYSDPEMGIVVDWQENQAAEVLVSECEDSRRMFNHAGVDMMPLTEGIAAPQNTSLSAFNDAGIGGSMARFTISGDYLYTIDDWSMLPFNISTLTSPLAGERIELGWGIETIFPLEDKLFLGAQNGMHIYDLANPAVPSYVSTYDHITSCDPVVVEGDYAYVTLRDGTECEGFTNQLDVINISNVVSPYLEYSYAMQHPHGLGIDEGTLFICEGDFGLKAYDATDISTIDQNQLAHFQEIYALDVIPLNDVLMMIGKDGLYQYDYQDLDNITLLSHIPIVGVQ